VSSIVDATELTAVEVLRALATATTQYYEAPPHRVAEARLEYELALRRFKTVQST
jgi:hypothetical protein